MLSYLSLKAIQPHRKMITPNSTFQPGHLPRIDVRGNVNEVKRENFARSSGVVTDIVIINDDACKRLREKQLKRRNTHTGKLDARSSGDDVVTNIELSFQPEDRDRDEVFSSNQWSKSKPRKRKTVPKKQPEPISYQKNYAEIPDTFLRRNDEFKVGEKDAERGLKLPVQESQSIPAQYTKVLTIFKS